MVEGSALVDGAFTNAVPGNVVKSMGANFVVGIALSPLSDNEITTYKTPNGKIINNIQIGFCDCDFLLEPDLSSYTATDVSSSAVMYDIGYECAKKHMDELFLALGKAKIKA